MSLPGQSTWCADGRPVRERPGSWRQPHSEVSTRSSWQAAAWQSSPQIQRTTPETMSWLHTPYHSCPEWTTMYGFHRCVHRGNPPSRRLSDSPSQHLRWPTAVGGAAPYLAVGGLKTASCSGHHKTQKIRFHIKQTGSPSSFICLWNGNDMTVDFLAALLEQTWATLDFFFCI